MPPRTLRATRTPEVSRVNTKTRVGIARTEPVPPAPRPRGGDGWPVDATNPALTSPMNMMNRPMPAVMASFSGMGTASKIMRRRPVTAIATMMRPSMTTRPIASGQVRTPTTELARNELMPSPAANAKGRRATTPNRMVMAPAASDVTAETWPKGSLCPAMSAVLDRMMGFSTMMYAIAMKVTAPPRSSAATVEPRAEISKNRSRAVTG